MSKFWRWVLGIALFLGLGAVGFYTPLLGTSLSEAQQSLAQSARTALADAGHDDWADVEVRGQTAYLTGIAPNRPYRAEAINAVRQSTGTAGPVVGGIMRIDSSGLKTYDGPPPVSPYRFKIDVEDQFVRLDHHFPSEAVRTEVTALTQTLFGGRDQFFDQTDLAGGMPTDSWPIAIKSGILALSELDRGVLYAEDIELRLSGVTSSASQKVFLRDQLASLPAPYRITADIDVDGTKETFAVTGSENPAPLVLPEKNNGVMTNPETDSPVTDNIEMGDPFAADDNSEPAPTTQNKAPSAAPVSQPVEVPSPAEASAMLANDRAVQPATDDQNGAVPSRKKDAQTVAAAAIKTTAPAAPALGLRLRDTEVPTIKPTSDAAQAKTEPDSAAAKPAPLVRDLLPVTAMGYQQPNEGLDEKDRTQARCQNEFDVILTMSRIEFRRGSATPAKESEPLIAALANVARRCAPFIFVVTGHTDNTGTDDSNLVLSRARAKEVRRRLIDYGVPAGRLRSEGAGASQPITENKDEQGRQKNRRVEITVMEPEQ